MFIITVIISSRFYLLITVTELDSETATLILRHLVAISTWQQPPVSSILL
jgi:hypothetical protein